VVCLSEASDYISTLQNRAHNSENHKSSIRNMVFLVRNLSEGTEDERTAGQCRKNFSPRLVAALRNSIEPISES
jgi:hypothetical protein